MTSFFTPFLKSPSSSPLRMGAWGMVLAASALMPLAANAAW